MSHRYPPGVSVTTGFEPVRKRAKGGKFARGFEPIYSNPSHSHADQVDAAMRQAGVTKFGASYVAPKRFVPGAVYLYPDRGYFVVGTVGEKPHGSFSQHTALGVFNKLVNELPRSNPSRAHRPPPPPTVLGNRQLALGMMNFHSGQGDPIYAVASSWYAGRPVDRALVEKALGTLEWLKATRTPAQVRGIGVVITAIRSGLAAR